MESLRGYTREAAVLLATTALWLGYHGNAHGQVSDPAARVGEHADMNEQCKLLELVEAGRTRGMAFMASKKFREAIEEFKGVLALLGDRYASVDVPEDTDQRVLAARSEADKGRPGNAATLLSRVLETRTALYSRKLSCKPSTK
jgi:hypothetical protein